jgi:hypothetical protein
MLHQSGATDWIPWSIFYKQIGAAGLTVRFDKLAKCQNDFFPEDPGCNEWSMPLTNWVISALDIDPPFNDLISRIRLQARALRDSLQDLQQRHDRTAGQLKDGKENYSLDDYLFEFLPPAKIALLLRELSRAYDTIERLRVLRCHGRAVLGRQPGTQTYPGLRELVFDLEHMAQINGGAFTVHRKSGAKGTLVQALDSFRHCLLNGHPDLQSLAELLPPAGKHPVSLYERAVSEARKAIHR